MAEIRATVRRGAAYGQSSSYDVENGPAYANSNLPTYQRLSNFRVETHYYWQVEIPDVPELNQHMFFSHADAVRYATRKVRKLRELAS